MTNILLVAFAAIMSLGALVSIVEIVKNELAMKRLKTAVRDAGSGLSGKSGVP